MHQLAFKAYGEVTSRTASDKHIETALFSEITQSLQTVSQTDKPAPAEWADAIDRNLQLWTIISTDLLSAENQLDGSLKRNLIGLSESVRRISYAVLAGRGALTDLIEINEAIMKGLAGDPGQGLAGEAA